MTEVINTNTAAIGSVVITNSKKGAEMAIVNIYDKDYTERSFLAFGRNVDLCKRLQGLIAGNNGKAIFADLPLETSYTTELVEVQTVDELDENTVMHGDDHYEMTKETNILRSKGGLVLRSDWNGTRTGLLTAGGLIPA